MTFCFKASLDNRYINLYRSTQVDNNIKTVDMFFQSMTDRRTGIIAGSKDYLIWTKMTSQESIAEFPIGIDNFFLLIHLLWFLGCTQVHMQTFCHFLG